jgi:hypothetical protein
MIVDERARLAAVREYRILDTDPERQFDDLTLLASHICGTPMALLTLVDADRQWFKSRVGITMSETSRAVSFCAHAILDTKDVFEVTDALHDVRFSNNPLVVGEPHIRFYAGAPLEPPVSWHQAFRALQAAIEADSSRTRRTKFVLFFDELPWIATHRSGCLAELEHFWNAWCSRRNDIILIVCGSAASWMLRRKSVIRSGSTPA